jgi:hypothetical protein
MIFVTRALEEKDWIVKVLILARSGIANRHFSLFDLDWATRRAE